MVTHILLQSMSPSYLVLSLGLDFSTQAHVVQAFYEMSASRVCEHTDDPKMAAAVADLVDSFPVRQALQYEER